MYFLKDKLARQYSVYSNCASSWHLHCDEYADLKELLEEIIIYQKKKKNSDISSGQNTDCKQKKRLRETEDGVIAD